MTSISDITSQLKASFLGCESTFKDDDLVRNVKTAIADYSRFRPLVMVGNITLQAGTALYPCPDGLSHFLGSDWGRAEKLTWKPWDDRHPGRLPDVRVTSGQSGRMLMLMPAPNTSQISALGAEFIYRYGVAHTLDDKGTTLLPHEEPVVLLRAQAEALQDQAKKHASTPYQVRDGITSTPRNGTPSFLFSLLMAEFDKRVRQ